MSFLDLDRIETYLHQNESLNKTVQDSISLWQSFKYVVTALVLEKLFGLFVNIMAIGVQHTLFVKVVMFTESDSAKSSVKPTKTFALLFLFVWVNDIFTFKSPTIRYFNNIMIYCFT